MQKSVLVIGATGYLGGEIVRCLLGKNVKIKAFVRPTTDSRELMKLGVEICNGDLAKSETIEKALQGVDVVISSAIGYSNRKIGDSLKSVDDIGNKNLIDALKKENIQHLFLRVSLLPTRLSLSLTSGRKSLLKIIWIKSKYAILHCDRGLSLTKIRKQIFMQRDYAKGI